MKIARLLAFGLLFVSGSLFAQAGGGPGDSNLLSWGAGALVVQAPPSYSESGNWAPDALLDEELSTGWATPAEDLSPKVFVFEMAERSTITSIAFDTKQVENAERGAKDVRVEISDRPDGGFTLIAAPSLAKMMDHQKFALKAPATGRYIRLTALNNWGDPKYIEIMNIYAFGKPLAHRLLPDNSGTFSSTYDNFHLQQTGSTVNGCYEHDNGLVENGGFDGRVLRFTWKQGDPNGAHSGGPAMLIFSDDGQSFTGYWWNDTGKGPAAGAWNGKRVSADVGSCPNWQAGENNVTQQLSTEGRARLYGILFDTDSDHLKPESKPTLDELVATASSQKAWSFLIEGHTDNVGGDAHNQALSDKRALAVKAYLVTAGVDAGRLTTQGFGATKPVSTNDTELGRSQNRRVEVAKK